MSSPTGLMNITLNPYTPMSFLPEDAANLITVQTYAGIGSLGVLLWDIIMHLPQDYQLATRSKINAPFIVYCISRISCLAYILGIVIGSTAPVGDCSIFKKISFIYPIAVPSTLLLFVFRVCALYNNRTSAIIFFSTLWLGVLACSILMPFGISSLQLGSTGYCVEIKTDFTYSIIDFAPFVHDSIIFLATSWAFISKSRSYQDMNLKNGLKVLIFGNFLPSFSKTILRDGQFYYLTILVLNIVVIIAYHVRYPWLSNCTFGFPLFVLMNTLATHIYRSIRFNVYAEHSITSSEIRKVKIGNTTGGGTTASSNSKSNNSPFLNIVFKKSETTTSGTGPYSLHAPEEIASVHGEVGELNSEKKYGEV